MTDIEVLEITGSGVLFGQAFLDVDGTGDFSPGDDPIPDAAVTLVAS
ncbi:MAG: hypothetical protein GWN07_22845, partial [Actinobacteria bacterium]|nr:hypothetical protein [Actinomycetota bacterium]NIS33327.1 hypothetical protein [Actinomycetota bacterium]NIT96823.1 hypothetical protein [Actinomycetota bacterium]NIU68229.1 hypothetical protein [Actinomycetota bacterium]NIW30027.1 hypothetical protein [Actinomycetota bacterium]